jgi:serine/threonine-protein kinase
MHECPTPEQLDRWLQQQQGSAVEDHALAAHIDACRRCQQTLEELTAGVGGAAGAPASLPKDAPVLGRLKAGPPNPPAAAADSSTTESGLPTPPGAARLDEETRALLQRRLRVFCVVAVVVFSGAAALYLGASPAVLLRSADWLGGTLLAAALLTSLVCAAVVWVWPALSLAALRRLELLLIGLAAAFFVKHRYTALVHGPEGAWEGPGHRNLFILQAMMVNNTMWSFLIVCYGVFIPNTWRRCVVVVVALAVVPLALTAVAGLLQPAVGAQLGLLAGVTVMALFVSAALAVFGSFKISTLQREALAARQLGQYQLKERLGVGGMGEVYLAEHRLLKRPCAVKLIHPERASDPNLLRRFEREVQATARLSHPNTVEVYDYGHAEDGTFYYVMEYLPGLSLDEMVSRHGPLPPARAVHYLRQVCGALREAHQAGLVHRDIKPSNIIACNPGGLCDVVKLLDFGLVRPPDAGVRGRLTKEGLILGTPDFMSPEQARGEDTVDARSDLYSLGAVAYFLLSGRPPFVGRSVLETLMAHLQETPAPLGDAAGAAVPADLEGVVLRCLAKRPPERFGDAEALDRALGGCLCAGGWTEEQARRWWQECQEQAGKR